MLFCTPIFFFFFLPVWLGIYALLRTTSARNSFLIVASLFFYAWGEVDRIGVLLVVTGLSYCGARQLLRASGEKQQLRRLWFWVALCLLPLLCFKYARFFALAAQQLLGMHWEVESLMVPTLPLGISFFTFQAVSYLIDVQRKRVRPAESLKEYALYMTLFPHLIAGPIVRFKQLRARIAQRRFNLYGVQRGLVIFIAGMASKVLIANPLGGISDLLFTTPVEQLATGQTWLGALLFSMQIYFDFQGYSLMAIGLATMIGFSFPTNFNNPYQAQGIADFWRRWHISLSSWLRDYVYRPLAGRGSGLLRVAPAIMATFLLSGLWHGANWNFLIWGAYHGLWRLAELQPRWRRFVALPWVGQAFTFFIVMVGWVVFRIQDWAVLQAYLLRMFRGGASPILLHPNPQLFTPDILFTMGVAALLSFSPAVTRYARTLIFVQRDHWCDRFVIGMILLLSLMFMATQTFNPFIYFRF